MSKPITYWTDIPAVQSLCQVYGDRWSEMPIHERTAVMTAISACINTAVIQGSSLPLDEMVNQLLGDIAVSHRNFYPLLSQLDKELDALQDELYLVAGIAMSTPLKDMEGA